MTAVATAQRKPRLTLPANILAAIDDPAWWQPWFAKGDWSAWRSFLSAAFGLPMTADQLAIYQTCTGRSTAPTQQCTEAWCVAGRRGGKSRIMSLSASWLAAFVDWREYLAPGEIATCHVLAANRKQARVVFRYIRSLFVDHPTLSRLVARELDDALELTNKVVIEVQTANYRVVRGYSICAVIADELAFWLSDEDAANPAAEIIDSLRPAMATMPNSLLMVATSPYARKGPVWDAWRRHYAKDGDPILVWQAPTLTMNPTIDKRIIDEAYERDPANAESEFGAGFRSDIAAFVDREIIEAVTVPGCYEIAPLPGINYSAFVDPSGGSSDSFGLAIAHRTDDDRGVLDAVREIRPPFNPADAVSELAQLLKSYSVTRVVGDRYAGAWPAEAFRNHGIDYEPSERPKSDLYREALPLLNSRRVELLDHPRMIGQICALERRTARGGRDSIDHPPGLHDDLANVAAGVLVQVAGEEDPLAMWVRLNR
jgi:hypothetical protein